MALFFLCFMNYVFILVGEPINEEAWHWYHDTVGEGRCPIVDTWWQTGKFLKILILPLI